MYKSVFLAKPLRALQPRTGARLASGAAGNDTCAKFTPLSDTYNTLRHVHFDGITPFATGQQIQAAMVGANLDFKKMEAKIRKSQKHYASQGVALQAYEHAFLDKVLSMRPFPTLLTFEFENVYTGGKQMRQDPQLAAKIAGYAAAGCEYHQLERGGQVTWHGEGQLTAYLIMDLKQVANLTVRCFVDSVLLAAVQNMLAKNWALPSYTNANPGVWMAPHDLKLCSVGCHVQRAVTSYGVGINVRPDLAFLNSHEMCGMPGVRATSLAEMQPGFAPSVKDVGGLFAKEVARRLGMRTVEHMSGDKMGELPGQEGCT